MKCTDDCHNYELDTFLGKIFSHLKFYKMQEDGIKIDGVTNEEVIKVLLHRLNFFNDKWKGGKFRCHENSMAILRLEEALAWLEKRTIDRTIRGVEGTYEE